MYLESVCTRIMANGETIVSEGSYSDVEKDVSHKCQQMLEDN